MITTQNVRNNGRKQREKRGNFRNDKIQIEDVLEEHGLEFDFGALPEDDLDWAKSLENRGRLETPYNVALATRYQVAMEGGSLLPKPVVAKQRENGLHRILGGYHTATGARSSKVNVFDCYIVRVTDANRELVFEFLPKFLNMKGGQALSESEALTSAVWAVRKGKNVEQAASYFNIKPHVLKDELRRIDLTTVLRDNDVDTLDYFEKRKSTLIALGQLADNEPVMVAAAQVVIKGTLTQDQTLAFVRQVKEQKREADRLEVVAQWYEDHVNNRPDKPKQQKSPYSISIGWSKSVGSFLFKITCLSQLRGAENLSPETLWKDAQFYGELGDHMRKLSLKQRALAIQQGLIKSEQELPDPELDPLPRR